MEKSNQLIELAKSIELEIEEKDAKKIIEYMMAILEKNKNVNLTAIKNEDEFLKKQIIDSLMLLTQKDVKQAKSIIDVGTGAGFPGIPLAIAMPNTEFLLIDSLKKRLIIIEELCEKFDISNVKIVHARAEMLGKTVEHREQYDLCVSKAVAPLNVLVEYCIPFVKLGGSLYAYKGGNVADELKNSPTAVKKLGGSKPFIINSKYGGISGLENHNILKIKKIKKTPLIYPRKEGVPAKEPL